VGCTGKINTIPGAALWVPGGAGLVGEKSVERNGECGPEFGTVNKSKLFLRILAIHAISKPTFGFGDSDYGREAKPAWTNNRPGIDRPCNRDWMYRVW
jgi:hypothetical protein